MSFLSNHAVALMVGWYVLSAVVSGMPAPPPQAGVAYIWAYRSLHVLAGNLGQFIPPRANGGTAK